MNNPTYLFVGGLVAIGFDSTGKFLLTVSHSGRGVFSVDNWKRVARDTHLSYPDGGKAIGIGPIDGEMVKVLELNEGCNEIVALSPDGKFRLIGESDGITITAIDGT